MADYTYSLYGSYFIMFGERNGEQQLVVFATIHGGRDQVHIELFSHYGSLVIDRDTFFIDTASYVAFA